MLWAVPRSVSTAVERAFMQRADCAVLHEPFSDAYYNAGLSSQSAAVIAAWKARGDPALHSTYESCLAAVLAPMEGPQTFRFAKDMSYYVQNAPAGAVDVDALLERVTSTFLIRSPRKAVASWYRLARKEAEEQNLPLFFDSSELGFKESFALWERCAAMNGGARPAVIDADDVVADSEGTLRAYCEAAGLPFDPAMCSWDADAPKIEAWSKWQGWHDDAQNSSGFREVRRDADPLPPEAEAMVRECEAYYEPMFAARVRPAAAA